MKIGILTYHCVPNFGAQLQTLSMVGCLKSLGYDPIIINWYPYDLERMYDKRVSPIQVQIHRKFMEDYMPTTRICRTETDLIEIVSEYDIGFIVTGSDALFKYVPKKKRSFFSFKKMAYIKQDVLSCEDFPENPFFCDYYERLIKKIPIVAVSVSSQNCPYELMNNHEKVNIGRALKNFKSITVRDNWTKRMVEYLTSSSDIRITPDPVFAFNNNCYIHIPTKDEILAKYLLPQKYILFSFSFKHISDSYVHSIIKECNSLGYTPVALPMPEGVRDFDLERIISLPLSPIDWYALIKYSSGYIGERMHPIVVCLHNSIPFFSFDEYGVTKRYCGGLLKTHDIESSKTYHIVRKFDFLGNITTVRNKLPEAEVVMRNLLAFDTAKCNRIAQKVSLEFNNIVGEILKN